MLPFVASFQTGHFDADYPEVFRNDSTRLKKIRRPDFLHGVDRGGVRQSEALVDVPVELLLQGPDSRARTLNLGTSADDVTNAACADCHGEGQQWSPDKAHWLQELEDTVRYQHKIESVTLTVKPTATTAGELSVKYSLIDRKSTRLNSSHRT